MDAARKAICLRASIGSWTTSKPNTEAEPLFGPNSVARQRSAVVFPAPFGPRRAYTSPGAWNLGAPDYMLVVLKTNCTSQDIHTHTFRGDSYPIFAKLLIDAPFVNVSEELHFTTFSGHAKFNSLDIEFRNPDGTLAQFNGRPHNYTLLFTVSEDSAVLPCL